MVKVSEAKKTITVKQIASPIRREEYQAECLKALGLGRLNKVRTLEDNAIVQGLITKVRHMIQILPQAE